MEWGDAPAWAAFVVSVGALWVTIKARSDGKASAEASATSAEASVRSAVAAEEALRLQQQEAAERRAAEEEAARPRVNLVVEQMTGKSRYRMVNYGDAPASSVTVLDPPALSRGLNEPFTLESHEAHVFTVVGSAGKSVPSFLRVVWDGQDEPHRVLMPRV